MKLLEKQKENILHKKKKLLAKEAEIKLKEKKSLEKRFYELGKLLVKSNIFEFDDQLLLGAFIDIYERSQDENLRKQWVEKSKCFFRENSNNELSRLLVIFKNPPPDEIKSKLKQMKFKWNEFRGEYFGYGDKENLSKLLSGIECTIEEIQLIGIKSE